MILPIISSHLLQLISEKIARKILKKIHINCLFSNLLTFLRYHVEFGTWPRWFLYVVTSIFLLGHVDFSTKPRWFFYVHLYHKWSEKYSVIITKQCLQTCLSEILPIIVSAITKNHAHMVLKRVYYEWFFYTSDKKCTQMLTNVLTSA